MSGVAKAIGVAFAAVVLPMALPALAGAAAPAASIFSAGAAAGGGSILSTTLLQAGKSAIVGGLVSKATGGSFKDGAIMGGIAGGATSMMGGFGQVAGGVDPVISTKTGPATAGAATGTAAAGTAFAPAATAATAPATGFGDFLMGGENPLLGQVIKGAAGGYMQKAAMDSERGFIREQDDRIRDSYEGAGDAMRYGGPLSTRFEAANRRPAYRYNRDTRQIERA